MTEIDYSRLFELPAQYNAGEKALCLQCKEKYIYSADSKGN